MEKVLHVTVKRIEFYVSAIEKLLYKITYLSKTIQDKKHFEKESNQVKNTLIFKFLAAMA